MADINETGGKQTVNAMPESMKFQKTNVAKENDWKLLVEATQDSFGGVDCLVNNAGTTYRNKVRLLCQVILIFRPSVNGVNSQLWKSASQISTGALMSTSKVFTLALRSFFPSS